MRRCVPAASHPKSASRSASRSETNPPRRWPACQRQNLAPRNPKLRQFGLLLAPDHPISCPVCTRPEATTKAMFMDDDQLLRAYAVNRSEEAFRELVRRHVAIVHGVARRQAGIDAHLADDVTQRVFMALARKADSLRDQPTLVGWLYTAARLEAARTVRSEGRRRNWEGKAADMNQAQQHEPSAEVPWDQFRPVLDDAMTQLAEADRKAVLLRFFSGRSFADVGRVFQI